MKKLRCIVDWRDGNLLSPVDEKIELPSHSELCVIIESLLDEADVRSPPLYFRKDIARDVADKIANNFH